MTFYGVMAGDNVMLTNSGGKPIVDGPKPAPVDGYQAVATWQDTGSEIIRNWRLQPVEGTIPQAVAMLAKLQAKTLPDDQALKVPALFPQWSDNLVNYRKGDRVVYLGTLYRVLQDHRSQSSWAPDSAPSLFARVLPGQSGNETDASGKPGQWVQPDSTNPYKKGDKVTYKGHVWECTADGNVWAPGSVGAPWKQLPDDDANSSNNSNSSKAGNSKKASK